MWVVIILIVNNYICNFSWIICIVIPKEIHDLLTATAKYLEAGDSKDRNELFDTWRQRRIAKSRAKLTPNQVFDIISKVSESQFMGQFLDVDLPYRVDSMQPHRDLLNFMPKMIHVDTVTNLSINSPVATGYLVFEKSNFGNSVINELENPE